MESWYSFIGQYGYIAIFLLLTIGIVGLPLPDEILLTYLGYVTSLGTLTFFNTFLSAFLGALCGISISYYLGVKLGEPFIRKIGPKLFIKDRAVQKTGTLFNKYGPFVLFICYFIPGVRHVAAYLAGITEFSKKRFALFAYSGAFIWVFTFLIIGNRLGDNWEVVQQYLHDYIWLIIILTVIFSVILTVYLIRKKQFEKESV